MFHRCTNTDKMAKLSLVDRMHIQTLREQGLLLGPYVKFIQKKVGHLALSAKFVSWKTAVDLPLNKKLEAADQGLFVEPKPSEKLPNYSAHRTINQGQEKVREKLHDTY